MNTIKASDIKDIVPAEATHYIDDDGVDRFYIKHTDGYLLIGRNGVKIPCDNIDNYFKESITEIIYDTEFAPEVGMECEVTYNDGGEYQSCVIVGKRVDGRLIYEITDTKPGFYAKGEIDSMSQKKFEASSFRPIKSEEDKQREAWHSAWTRQCLETSDDTLSAEYSIGTFIEFLIKAGVKLPEGEQ